MSYDTSSISTKAREFLKKEFSDCPVFKAYESTPIYGDSLNANDIYYLLVITKDDIDTYTYMSYLVTEYEDYSDADVECISSKVLVTLSEPVYGEALMYISLIKVLAKKLEPHFEGGDNAEKIVIQTGKLGYPHIIKIIKACVYEFEGRKYTYSDVEDLIGYRE